MIEEITSEEEAKEREEGNEIEMIDDGGEESKSGNDCSNNELRGSDSGSGI